MLIDPIHAFEITYHALRSVDNPLLAHLVVTRRCNLACAYCTEYDGHSYPVPVEVLKSRVCELARLKTLLLACTGGEPLLHPEIAAVIEEVRSNGIVAMITTNGYPLTRNLIGQLNDAGLQALQISIDNLEPDETSSKSLSVLEGKLELLAESARFRVNVNSVLGPGDRTGENVVTIAERARHYGFSHSIGIAHDGTGAALPLSEPQRAAYHRVGRLSNAFLHALNYWVFQRRLLAGRRDGWRCRAGARYLYVCEDGLVHWCSQQRGHPAIPLEEYDTATLRESFRASKPCAEACTITCVRQVSMFDRWRGR